MRLVPCARVSVIHSEKMNIRIPKPRFSVIAGCIYNAQVNYKISLGGTSDVHVIKAQDNVELKE